MKDSLYFNIDYVDSEIKTRNAIKFICIAVSLISFVAFFIAEFFFKTKSYSLTIQNFSLFGLCISAIIFFFASVNKKVSRDLVNDLITKENDDDRLTNTVREIYSLKGAIYISDLYRIRKAVTLELQQYYDDTIKTGTSPKYTEEQASLMVNTEKRLIDLLDAIQPNAIQPKKHL